MGRPGSGTGGAFGGGHMSGHMGGGHRPGNGADGHFGGPRGGGPGPARRQAAPPPHHPHDSIGASLVGAAVGAAFTPRHHCPPPPYGYQYRTSYQYDECMAVLDALCHIRDGVGMPKDRGIVRRYFYRDVLPYEVPSLIAWMQEYLR